MEQLKNGIALAYNEYQIELNIASNTKIATTETVKMQEEKASANTTTTFLQFLQGENSQGKNYFKEDNILDVEALTGSSQSLGNGTDADVYKLTEDSDMYILEYYDKDGALAEANLWSVLKTSINNNLMTITIENTYGYEGLTAITIQYEEGMTWGEFINSEYNTNGMIGSNEHGTVQYLDYNNSVTIIGQKDTKDSVQDVNDVIDSSKIFYFVIPV